MAQRLAKSADIDRPKPDVWVAHCLREMALAMGGWLQSHDDLNKPVHRLSLKELQGMSWAAMAKYTELREIERIREGLSMLDEKGLNDLGFVIRDSSSGTS